MRALLVLATVTVVSLCLVAARDRPNIIVLLVDDLGFNDLSYMGSKDVKSPNLDKLMRDGVVFRDAYSVAGFCSPARAGLLTGKHPYHIGHWYNPPHDETDQFAGIPRGHTLLPSTLKKRAYETIAIGKWHLGFSAVHHPMKRGFDHFFGFLGGTFKYRRWMQIRGGFRQYIYKDWEIFRKVTHLTDDWFTGAINFITQNRHKPFFIYLAINAPHAPYTPKVKDLDMSVKEDRRVHVAMIKGIDDNVKRLRDHLEKLSLTNNTLILFTNDNGGHPDGAINFPLRDFKGALYEGGTRVPFSITWPGKIEPGQVNPMLVNLLDIYPTLQNIANVKSKGKNRHLQGIDLMPYIIRAGQKTPPVPPLKKRVIINRRANGAGSVRRRQFKALLGKDRKITHVFNLNTDIEEQQNMKGKVNAAMQRDLLDIFKRWNAKVIPSIFPAGFGSLQKADNPLSLKWVVFPETVKWGRVYKFEAHGYHSTGKQVFKYVWKVFTPEQRIFAQYNDVKPDVSKYKVQDRRKKAMTISFFSKGTWIVRCEITDNIDRFLAWKDREYKIK